MKLIRLRFFGPRTALVILWSLKTRDSRESDVAVEGVGETQRSTLFSLPAHQP